MGREVLVVEGEEPVHRLLGVVTPLSVFLGSPAQ
jgi:hypothetical protein